ncbi:MAG: quinate 5-dehydrogenase [Chloroflexi bacterium]|nr:MAG: quinate 5-dehydrogenase [Chloroflexota bacterium]
MHIVSISLGSSKRNQRSETTLFGRRMVLERIGTDGDQQRARALFVELDGKVDAFGVGGADLGITVNGRYYQLRAVQHLVAGLRTPAVDGGGVRAVMERQIARRMELLLPAPVAPRRVLIATAVARYDMARSFLDAGYDVILGDLGFGLGIGVPIRSLRMLHLLARLLLPVMSRLPFEWLYPTGEKQEEIRPKFGRWYEWATVIADDFHYIKRHLPERLNGRIIVTNTTTADDVELLRARGVRYLVTSTPRLEGRTFGTNVIEAALVALAGKGRALTPDELAKMLGEDDLKPTVLALDRPLSSI